MALGLEDIGSQAVTAIRLARWQDQSCLTVTMNDMKQQLTAMARVAWPALASREGLVAECGLWTLAR